MKHKYISIAVIAITIAGIIYACKPDTGSSNNSVVSTQKTNGNFKKNNGATTQSWTSLNLANSNNPFDSVGIIHNEGLDYILGHAADTTTITSDSLITLIGTFIYYSDNPGLTLSQSILLADSISADTNYDLWSNSSTLYVSYLTQIDSLMNKCSLFTYDTIIAHLKMIENNVKNDSYLDSVHKDVLLVGCAIGRYSEGYWYCNAGFPVISASIINKSNNIPSTQAPGLGGKISNGAADLLGGFFGAWHSLATGHGPMSKDMSASTALGALSASALNGGGGGGGCKPGDGYPPCSCTTCLCGSGR